MAAEPPTERAPPSGPLARTAEWLAAGQAVALATVIKTWGSSPLPAGSQLAVNADGDFVGSVSGGCVEAAVIAAAAQVIAGGAPQELEFGVTDAQAQGVGLACGGKLSVYLERAERTIVDTLTAAGQRREPLIRCIDLDSGSSRIHRPGTDTTDATRDTELQHLIDRQAGTDRSTLVEHAGRRIFVQLLNPPLRLIIVGAVHIAQHLAPIAEITGYRVTVIDPRLAFATRARFGESIELNTEWPDRALEALSPDARTAVVVLTHDAKLDEPALAAALRTPAFYIGALGSERTQAQRRSSLAERGADTATLARIHGPVGLALGSRVPAEIAVAILAEMTGVLRGSRRARAHAEAELSGSKDASSDNNLRISQ